MSLDLLLFFPGKSRYLFIHALLFYWLHFVIIVTSLLLLLFPISVALASLRQVSPVPAQQDLARAGVSVVRLLVSYTQSSQSTQGAAPTTSLQCTGLGVLVGSGVTGNQQENWVLTDASLLNTGKAACVLPSQPSASLSSIEIYTSSAYNSTQVLTPLATIQMSDLTGVVTQNNLSVFPFSSTSINLLPCIDVAQADPTSDAAIYLSKSTDAQVTLPPAAINGTNQVAGFKPQILQYLTPLRKAVTSTQDIVSAQKEAGQPLVNSIGQLSGMALANGTIVTSQDIEKLLQSVSVLKNPPANIVHDDWNTGITNYYAGVANAGSAKQQALTQAQGAFADAFQKNSQFQGAQVFVLAAQSAAAPPGAKPRSTATPTADSPSLPLANGNIYGIPIWLSSLMLLILLVTILAAVYMISGRLRAGRRQAPEEYAPVHLEPPPIGGANIVQSLSSPPTSTTPVLSSNIHPPAQVSTSPIDAQQVRCPACGVHVQRGTSSCPNCHQSLSSMSQTPPQSDQSFRQPEKPIVAIDPPQTSSFANPVLDVSMMKEPVQQHRPAMATPESMKLSAGKEPEILLHSSVQSKGQTNRVGQRLGNYRLVRVLGHGGFADVYLGEHVFLKTQAAIKVLHTRLTRETLVSFLHEARTIAELIHPHIVRVLEFGVEGDEPDLERSVFDADGCIPYLIMDYASGGTLRQRHPKGSHLPLPVILPYVKHVADALQYAHDKRLIHRDIKPQNMLLGHNNEVLLSDFGIAAVAHSERSMSTQEMAGTVPYMAPEQIRGKPRPASDQYALAIVIYEWLCGSRPFQGSQWEIIDQHMSAFPLPMYKKGVAVSPVVESVVMKALAKDPLQRFDSIRAFAQAFEQACLSR